MRGLRPSNLNRRALFRIGGAAAAVNLATLAARAEEPAKPATPMPPVEAYATPPFVDQIALSPDGSKAAVITYVEDRVHLVHFNIDVQDMKRLDMGPGKIRGLFFADNDHVVVVNSATLFLGFLSSSRQEFYTARFVNLDSYASEKLYARQKGFYDVVMGDLHRIKVDGKYRVTASNYRVHSDNPLCLYSFTPDSPYGDQIHVGVNNTEGWVVRPDGHPVAYANYSASHKVWTLYYNRGKRGKGTRFDLIYKTKAEIDPPELIGLGRDGESLLVYIDDDDAFGGGYYEIAPDGTLGPALDSDGTTRERAPLFHPATGRLAGFSHYDDWFSYDYFDPVLKKIAEGLKRAMGDDYRVAIEGFAEDPRQLILYAESPTDAGSYYFADFSTGELQLLAENYTGIPKEWLSDKSPIVYTAGDGVEIHGYLTLPPCRTPKNLPLVVLPHGGPQSRDTIGFDWQVQCLAARGYAVLQPNFRGSTGYGKAFVEKGYGQWGRRMQTDLSDGVRWVAAQGTIDPARVAILGASYGGYAALAGATLDPGVYRCAVSIAGVSDLAEILKFEKESTGGSPSRAVRYWKRFLGDPKTFAEVSPARQADKAYCPILLIHGTDDTVVPIDQSKRMEKALKDAGKPVEFVTYAGQDHWETVGSHRIEMMKSALAFLEKHNPA